MNELANRSMEELLALAEHDPEAQFQLGLNYANGDGVRRDWEKCVEWSRRAAENGHPGGQFNLGCCYDLGKGVPRDMVQAAKWYRKAAEQGDAESQYVLFMLYTLGRGVPRDTLEASKWCVKAAAQGHKPARDTIRKVNSDMLAMIDRGETGVDALLNAAEQIQKNGGLDAASHPHP